MRDACGQWWRQDMQMMIKKRNVVYRVCWWSIWCMFMFGLPTYWLTKHNHHCLLCKLTLRQCFSWYLLIQFVSQSLPVQNCTRLFPTLSNLQEISPCLEFHLFCTHVHSSTMHEHSNVKIWKLSETFLLLIVPFGCCRLGEKSGSFETKLCQILTIESLSCF
jgi:hypothetical protein